MLDLSLSTHLILDFAGCPVERIKDKDLLERFLNQMPERIGMTLIFPAKVIHLDAEDQIDSGFSGFSMLAESHISAHLFSYRGSGFVDIFSCKPFDTALAASYVVDFFQADRISAKTIERGAAI